MRKNNRAFTLIEVLVVITILATLAGMVSLIIPVALELGNRTECINNVRSLVGMLEADRGSRYPKRNGPSLLMHLVARGRMAGNDQLGVLFCPGDLDESLDGAGGAEAYRGLQIDEADDYSSMTSYAARAQAMKKHRTRRGAVPAAVLVADDSADHHRNEGIVVGLTGGSAVWRDKMNDYGLAVDASLTVGEDSSVEELRALRAE
ncbi:MAG: prepilin-type N-terminal cleavage/methylation domain-containing protein [Planctomycetota bacterium]